MDTNKVGDNPPNDDHTPLQVKKNVDAMNQTNIPTPNQTTSGAAATASIPSGLSFKDKATLIISILALVISTATFVIGRLDARATRAKEAAELAVKKKSQDYKAYSLGQQVVRTFLFWFEVPKGEKDPQKLAKAKEFGAFEVSKLQQLSDLLDLRISDIRSLLLHRTQLALKLR